MEEIKAETHTHTQNGDMLAQWMRKIISSCKQRNRGTLWALHAGLCLQFLLVLVDLVGK